MAKGGPQREMSEGVNATKGEGRLHRMRYLSFLASSALFVSP
jgi:hypothetical protein